MLMYTVSCNKGAIFTSRMPTRHMSAFRLLSGRFGGFCHAGVTYCTNFTHIGAGVGCGTSEAASFMKCGNMNEVAYPMHDSYEIFGVCREFREGYSSLHISERVPNLWGFNLGCIFPEFSVPLIAKLYIGPEGQISWGLDFTCRWGWGRKITFF